jgi:hypothetical protein
VIRRKRWLAAAVTAVAVGAGAIAAVSATAGPQDDGFKTARPDQLVPTAPGVVVDKILSVGDIIPEDQTPDYQMSGIPDGIGAYKDKNGTLQVLMNHELGATFPGVPPGVNTRISKLTLNRKTHGVLSARYVFRGTEGFERFCSSTLEVINGTPYYFTGEEAIPAGHDGSSIVMNAETGTWTETRHFGHLEHENVVPVLRLSKFMVVTTEDDFRVGNPAYFYAYIAKTFEGAVAGTEGSLYVWRANDLSDTAFTMSKGDTIEGHFVPISQAENTTSATLKAASTARSAFRFARLEDATVAHQTPGRVYVADTGKPGEATLRGRVYQFDIDPSDPTQASLTVLLDGDTGDDMYNPDNMGASPRSLMIQEDRESQFRDPPFSGGYGRILKYDLTDGSLVPVARVNTPPPLRPGTWESSGIVWAGDLLGGGWWLTDVQAHSSFFAQPGPTLVPNSATGEDGQFQALYVPQS